MGVYDFFKGDCPACLGKIDCIQGDEQPWGEIQTKIWATPDEECCFRSFYPGMRVPSDPGNSEIVIGRTCCCDSLIKACFDGDLLVCYKLVQNNETGSS